MVDLFGDKEAETAAIPIHQASAGLDWLGGGVLSHLHPPSPNVLLEMSYTTLHTEMLFPEVFLILFLCFCSPAHETKQGPGAPRPEHAPPDGHSPPRSGRRQKAPPQILPHPAQWPLCVTASPQSLEPQTATPDPSRSPTAKHPPITHPPSQFRNPPPESLNTSRADPRAKQR